MYIVVYKAPIIIIVILEKARVYMDDVVVYKTFRGLHYYRSEGSRVSL